MKTDLQNSPERLAHALLAEDARLPHNAPDQKLLDEVTKHIATPSKARTFHWRKSLALSSLAACVLLFFVLSGLGVFTTMPPMREVETIISYQAPTAADEVVPRRRQTPTPPASTAPIANVITAREAKSISIPESNSVAEVITPEFGSMDSFGLGFGFEDRAEAINPVLGGQLTTARYSPLVDPRFLSPLASPLSTFSIDTDRASYTNLRNNIRQGLPIPADSVRVEELINAFTYDYAPPVDEHPFAVHLETAACPWNADNRLVRIALKGKEITERPATNLVLLCDVSGSMDSPHKLGYLKASFMELVENLDERDTVSIVTYAGSEGVALPPTKADAQNRQKIFTAIETLRSGGSTNGEAGIKLAYTLANQNFLKEGVNRVILATDGDFNVGMTGDRALIDLVKSGAQKGTYLTVLGFGNNLNDSMLEKITNDGNGQYFFIDSQAEGHRVFGKELTGTLVTIAKDVKIQVEFNPAQVAEYRLIGYANRQLQDEDFNNDRIDAGEIGAGHTVTAFYEIVPGQAKPLVDDLKYGPASPTNEPNAESAELMTVKLRYKEPTGTTSKLLTRPVLDSGTTFEQATADFRFASAVALYGMILRDTDHLEGATLPDALNIARPATKERPARIELLELIENTTK